MQAPMGLTDIADERSDLVSNSIVAPIATSAISSAISSAANPLALRVRLDSGRLPCKPSLGRCPDDRTRNRCLQCTSQSHA